MPGNVRNVGTIWYDCALPNNVPTVEVCDATMLHSSYTAGYPKNILLMYIIRVLYVFTTPIRVLLKWVHCFRRIAILFGYA